MNGPGRPQYLNMEYESPARFGVNGVPLPPEGPAALASSSLAASPASEFAQSVTRAFAETPTPPPKAPPFKNLEEQPVKPGTNDALLSAIAKVHRVALARIKYHETEAARLREALAPFAGLAGPTGGGSPAASPSAESQIAALVEAVKLLAPNEDSPNDAPQP